MQRYPAYTRDRVLQTAARVSGLVHARTQPPERLLLAGPVERIPYEEATRLDYRPVEPGLELGPPWATFWLDTAFVVPDAWDGRRVDLYLVTGSESTVWVDGRAVHGLTTGDVVWRADATLAEPATAGQRLEPRIEIACSRLWGDVATSHPHQLSPLGGSPYRLGRCELALFDEDAWSLSCDLGLLTSLMLEHERALDPSWGGELLSELNRFCNVFDESERATWEAGREILRPLLARRNGDGGHEISAVGHAHIDTAWLWPLAETYRKCVRTFSTQAAYMDRYPDYRFVCSQAQQYAWIRDRDPDLWRRIEERIERGQWLPIGGTWIEPDCNLPSGESLVRQFLYGQRFFEQHFGSRHTLFWNPDVFGYNGQLPQIMRGAGIDRFLTQKLSWNRFNRPPYHSFVWRGIDGSEVLTHFPPANTYNSEVTVEELRRSAREYLDHDRSRESLMVFGYGDGGGGPTPQMLENLRRVGDLNGVPRTQVRHPDEFFDRLAAERDGLATIVGELYFEYHRGTYTSQARTKRGNRLAERRLHDAELVCAVADRLQVGAYPREELDALWRLVLLNQFHDILPGSSIREVYEEAERDLAHVAETAGGLARRAADALAGAGPQVVPFNTIGVARHEVVELADGGLAVADAPPCGVGALVPAGDAVSVRQSAGGAVLENACLRAELAADGTLVSLVHRPSGREALAAPGNVLELYDDRPTDYDAWDIDPFALETGRRCPDASGWEVVRSDPLRAELACERPIGQVSRLRQVVRLDAHGRRLELHCTIDWHEDHRLLKVLFPLAVHAPQATYEMQFGVVERPTHYSTSYDLARYEVCGHRFADLSEHGFGVSLLSAATYGWSAYGGDVRLTLLRAPRYPDPQADVGRHEIAFAILPHAQGWQEAGVTGEALAFNSPLLLGRGDGTPRSYASCDDANLLLDTVKRAEDGEGLVLRLYEAHGARGTAHVRLGLPHGAAQRCNLLEDAGEPVARDGDDLVVPYRPFEIISLLVDPAG